VDFSLVNYKFFMRNYSDSSVHSTGVLRDYSYWMRNGFSNARASYITPEDRMPMENPWFRSVGRSAGQGEKSNVK
jgi:hypothetical protein